MVARNDASAFLTRRFNPRDIFITCVFLLLSLGTVMVFSSSAFHWSVEGDAYYFLRRQLAWLPIAVLGCLLVRHFDYRILRSHYWEPLILSVVLLAIVLIPAIGRDVNHSRRWLPLGAGLQFQPSELAKLAVILFVAGFMAGNTQRKHLFVRGFLVVGLSVLPVFALVLIEPDFGSAVFILGLAGFVLVMSGIRKVYLLLSTFVLAPLIGIFVHARWEQIHGRLLGFLEPDNVYQVKQSLTALGAGGMWGVGLGASGQKLRFLPEPHTDFILAILGEELGLVGCLGVLLLFLFLLWSGASIVWRTRDLFGFLLGAGVVVSLTFQAVINVAVVTASFPTKGIPLPFLTHGGSGLCMTLAQVGLLLSIERVGRLDSLSPSAGGESVPHASSPASPVSGALESAGGAA
jgi:cell division protein FtsW